MTLRATRFARAQFLTGKPWASVVLESGDRHMRRKVVKLQNGDEILVDLSSATRLEDQDCLVLEDGRLIQVMAADEDLLEVTAGNPEHLAKLAWHIGNRHLEAQIETSRIFIRPDHVIANMLEQLGAKVRPVRASFTPEYGAYHTHSHGSASHEH